MNKKLLLALCFSFTLNNLFAQKEAWNWYFGDHAGVTFSTGSPVALTNNAFLTGEGVATISDTSGNLLFYTDGSNVYDATHDTMPNGSGLLGHPSSTQSAIIVQKPGSNNLYYIFTVDYNHNNTSVIGTGFRYSVVDITLHGGLGDIIQNEKNILVRQRAYEKLTAIRHANNTDFWILINDWVADDIYSFHLSSSGLDTIPVISGVGGVSNPIHGHTLNTLGYIKASRQNNKIALGRWAYNSFMILDFNNATGLASNRININGTASSMNRTYGIEFSPDGKQLYGTTMASPFKVFQFDLSYGIGDSIFAHKKLLATHTSSLCNNYYYGALQIAPDGKIYGTTECDSFLNVINYPDSLDTLCNFVSRAVPLSGKKCKLGLPNFVADYAFPVSSISENFHSIKFNLYPNPNNGNFKLVLENIPSNETLLILRNILGQKSDEIRLTAKTTDINFNVKNGIYFATISTLKGNYTTKISIQR